MQNEKLIINSENGVIEYREGKLPDLLPVKEQKIITVSGDIKTITNYVTVRKDTANGTQVIDKSKAIVEVNKFNRTITLKLDPESPYGATVVGKLETSQEIAQFYLNQDKKFDKTQLIRLIKFSRLFFDDREKHASLLASLMKLRIKTESDLKLENDNRGNRTTSSERKVIDDSGFAQFFTLFIPVFKGFSPVKIMVEICYEPTETGIIFWLESPEFIETIESQLDELINKELECLSGFVIVNQ